MDHELNQLKRAMDTNPGDAEATRAYEAALLRAGRREDAKQLYGFKLRCPFERELQGFWDEREDFERSRVCTHCDREVRLIQTPEELKSCIEANSCAAIQRYHVSALDFVVDDPDVKPSDVKGLCKVDLNGIVNPLIYGTPAMIDGDWGLLEIEPPDLQPE